MIVTAAKGLKVPMEFKPRDYVTDDAVFKVEDSAYYARRISDGDLVEAAQSEWQAQVDKQDEQEAAQIKAAEAQDATTKKKAAKTSAE